MKIRTAKKNDIEQMVDLIKKTFSQEDAEYAHSEINEMFSDSIVKPNYMIAEENGKIIGITGFSSSWFDFNMYEIFWVGVDPNVQKKGIGKLLVAKVLEEIGKFSGQNKADMAILSTEAVTFFEKCGFEKISQLRNQKGFLMVYKF
jgi:N-acetylglutamate synthase-like GNAT family acetyltransferase